jgi:EndoU nuclease-like protein
MVFDRASEDPDGPGEARPELHLHHGRTGGDAHAPQKELPETRSRAECYDAIRAADSGSDRGQETKPEDSHAADNRSEQDGDHQSEANAAREGKSGWDAIEAEKRPALDSLRVTPDRETHILDGDAYGGGHRHGTGRPGKTEFPASWSDEKILNSLLDVASRPDQPPEHQKRKDRWLAQGTREDVEIVAVVTGDGDLWSGWPKGGPGVVRNPREK